MRHIALVGVLRVACCDACSMSSAVHDVTPRLPIQPPPLSHPPCSEIKDYLKENPAFAKSFVDAGTSFIAANPALALSAAQGAVSAGLRSAEGGQAGGGGGRGGYVAPVQDQQGAKAFANQF